MYSLDHILVCLDLSEMDDFLIRYSGFLLEKFQPKSLTFIHVMKSYDIPKDLMDSFPDVDDPLTEMVREDLQEKVDETLPETGKVDVKVRVEEGVITETIIQYGREHNITLTVLGKKVGYEGRGGIARKVLSLMPSSVLMVSETTRLSVEHMLVRMDFSKMSDMAMKMALKLKKLTGASISIHHVNKLPLHYFSISSVRDKEKLQKKIESYSAKEFARFKKRMRIDEDFPFTTSIDFENEEANILYSRAVTIGADMIVIGSRIKSSMADVIMESTSEKLAAAEKNMPVLVVKDRKKTMGFLEAIFE